MHSNPKFKPIILKPIYKSIPLPSFSKAHNIVQWKFTPFEVGLFFSTLILIYIFVLLKLNSLVFIEEGATLGCNIKIGPFSSIGKDVIIEDNVIIHENVIIKGKTIIGAGTEIYPFATLGLPPQDLKYGGEKSQAKIGKNCQIREHVTIHAGTAIGTMLPKLVTIVY